ncbi:hypothetical protein SprV_0100306000 [Sparganum proliferum]
MHLRSRRLQLLDYVLLRRRDRQDVVVTIAIYVADGCANHKLGVSKMRFRPQSRWRPPVKRSPGKLNAVLLHLPAFRFHFSNQLIQLLEDLAETGEKEAVETRRCRLQDSVYSNTMAALGRVRRNHQDWFDDNDAGINSLLAEKKKLHRTYLDL